MLTNNYKVGVGILMEGGNSSTYEDMRTIVDINGVERSNITVVANTGDIGRYIFFAQMDNPIFSGKTNIRGVIFGTGTGAPSAEDHKLKGELLSGMAATCTSKVEVSGNTFVKTVVYTITNNNDDDKTIGEVGIINSLMDQNKNSNYVLVDHTYLDNPVTIPAKGGVGQVTYTITLTLA